MIDIEKLKLAHELIYKLSDKYKATMSLHWSLHPDDRVEYDFQMGMDDWLFFKSLDDLITKLQELTRPKAKYSVDDEVWLRSDRDIIDARIDVVIPYKNTFKYQLAFDYCDMPDNIPPQIELECDLYPTKDCLIDDQVMHWQSLRDQAPCLKTPEKSTGSEDVSMEPTCHPVRANRPGDTLRLCVTCNSPYWDAPPPIPSKPQPKYSLNQCVWYAGKDGLLKKKITSVFDCDGEFEYELGDINRLDPMNKIRVSECRLFSSLLATEQGQFKHEYAFSNLNGDCMGVTCEHEYTLLSGFRCVKCDKNSISNYNGDCMGVTNEAITPAIESYVEHQKDKQLAEECGMDVKEICQHECDGMDYVPGLYEKVLASSELTPTDLIRFNKCKKCGEFYR